MSLKVTVNEDEPRDAVVEIVSEAVKGTTGSPLSTTGTNDSPLVVHADPRFRLLAAMNPGGDYGKKEVCACRSAVV